jgi:peptidoglycan/LPS O-acetylase OafA/YrhL
LGLLILDYLITDFVRQAPAASNSESDSIGSKPLHMEYRADVDGLRAVAVLGVFAFHANVSALLGAFTGVDVFFVISGWLITSQIVAGVANGTFTIGGFYRRRILRIVPALLAMLLVLMVWAVNHLYPEELIRLAQGVVATVFSVSNLYLRRTVGYFDDSSAINPVLHTWSLGVEEQFYIVFPVLIMAIARWWPRRRNIILIALAVLSFITSVNLSHSDLNGAFYLPQSRGWELLIGSLLAIAPQLTIKARWLRELISCSGLAALLFAFHFYNRHTPFPGYAALLPCAGTAFIILAGGLGKTTVSSVLSCRPLVFVGKISYSLYLWHLPLIVMQRVDRFVDTGFSARVDGALVVLLAFAMAILSWMLVEQPFRRKRGFSVSNNVRVALAVCGMAVACLTSLWIIRVQGLPNRFSPRELKAAAYLSWDSTTTYRRGTCFLMNNINFSSFNKEVCLARSPEKKSYLLIGDSHAADLYAGLKQLYGDRYNILQANAIGCLPMLSDRQGDSPCNEMNRYIFNEYLPTHSLDLLIISARWDGSSVERLRETIEWTTAHGIRTAIVGPSVEFDGQLPRLLAASMRKDGLGSLPLHVLTKFGVLDNEMASMVATTQATYLSVYKTICPSQCTYTSNGEPIMFDTAHLTKSGSVFIASSLKQSGRLVY